MSSSPRAKILPTHTPRLFAAAVAEAADHLKRGELVALPTETVYGLAANALNEDAVERIFQIKGRPAHNPIIVHLASIEMARHCAADWPADAERLAKAFWPGPLTIVCARAARIPRVVTAGGSTVGLRWPSHPFIQAVIHACGFPLAAPSANRSNELSPTSAEHVLRSLGSEIQLIVDGGPCQIGIESTVVDATVSPPRVLRPGMIDAETLAAVRAEHSAQPGAALPSPGMLPRHYAPHAPLRVLSWGTEEELREQIAREHPAAQSIHIIAHERIPSSHGFTRVSVVPHDAEAYARALYAELHRCDAEGADLIIVEAVPNTPLWEGIRDRLRRASDTGAGS